LFVVTGENAIGLFRKSGECIIPAIHMHGWIREMAGMPSYYSWKGFGTGKQEPVSLKKMSGI
jgi:hypothetical protein